LDRLRSTIYARLEAMSFRSGAAVSGGVLAAAGLAITLAVALGGHSAAGPSAGAVARSTPPPSPVLPAAAAPSSTARATPVASLMPAAAVQPPVPATVVPIQQAAASAAGVPTPRFPRPAAIGQPFPAAPDRAGLSSLSRAGAPEWRRDGRLDRDGGGFFGWRRGRLRL
jgi:hypothetical protein